MSPDWDNGGFNEPKTLVVYVPESVGIQEGKQRYSDYPRADSSARLIFLSGQDTAKSYVVHDGIMIGRSVTADIRINESSVSRCHAYIRKSKSKKDKYYIEDQGSSNGTFVNGLPVTTRVLNFGDKIRLGSKAVMLFTRSEPLENKLLESQKLESLGRLARGVAHDFNNLLGTVLFNIEYLAGLARLDEPIDKERLLDTIQDSKETLRQASNLTDQLLRFSRNNQIDERPTSITKVLNDIVAFVQRAFDRAIHVKTEIDSNLFVVGDSSQLHQVFMNLCINARDAMPNGGNLHIKAHLRYLNETKSLYLPSLDPGPHIVASFADDGIGMGHETLQHIFDPFFTTKAPGKGSGLGLATVYGIVKNHGGQIHVESDLGKGTTFRVYLPASSLEQNDEENNVPEVTEAKTVHATILLVEDEERMQNSTRKILEQQGHEVLCCSNGVEALELYKNDKSRIDLILLDVIMPEMGGLETLRNLKRINPLVKVILVSGFAEEQQVEAAQREGIISFIRKPCDAVTLRNEVNRALEDSGG